MAQASNVSTSVLKPSLPMNNKRTTNPASSSAGKRPGRSIRARRVRAVAPDVHAGPRLQRARAEIERAQQKLAELGVGMTFDHGHVFCGGRASSPSRAEFVERGDDAFAPSRPRAAALVRRRRRPCRVPPNAAARSPRRPETSTCAGPRRCRSSSRFRRPTTKCPTRRRESETPFRRRVRPRRIRRSPARCSRPSARPNGTTRRRVAPSCRRSCDGRRRG